MDTVPALGVVHEEQVEEPVSSVGQPDEFVLQVVVRLLPQTVLANERQLGETLKHKLSVTHHRLTTITSSVALTGQMFSLGVPSSWTIRSTCWISDVPGSKGL